MRDYFHACEDKQEIRDAVFDLLSGLTFTVQATVMEKSKAQPQTRVSEERFYQYGWLYHLKHSHKKFLAPTDSLQVTAATIGTKAKRILFEDGVRDVCRQIIPLSRCKTAFWPSHTDPCLQIADYCTWAIQRKWERGDARSYALIDQKIDYEYDLWSHGVTHYF